MTHKIDIELSSDDGTKIAYKWPSSTVTAVDPRHHVDVFKSSVLVGHIMVLRNTTSAIMGRIAFHHENIQRNPTSAFVDYLPN